MRKKTPIWITLLLAFSLAACSTTGSQTTAVVSQPQSSNATASVTTQATQASAAATTVSETAGENSDTHEDADDYTWDEAAVVSLTLSADSISASGEGVSVDGSIATITAAGTYRISGALSDGQIIVNTNDEETVRLILNGVDIHSSASAPIYIMDAEKVVIVLADGTQNTLTDGDSYTYTMVEDEEPNAALFSKADLTITGSGALDVTANFRDGISSKDGLIIKSGSITVSAVDDAIRGKDYLVIEDGVLNVTAQGDGLKSDNEDDPTLGYIAIQNGQINVTSSGDAINAQTDVLISGGSFNLTSGGGSTSFADASVSSKGIKGLVSVNIAAGTFVINSADDTIHSNASIVVAGGSLALASGDDALHADGSLEVSGGEILVSTSYEGLESAIITINGGNINVTSSDDGINIASGVDGSGTGGPFGGAPGGQDPFAASGDYYLQINGGVVYVNSNGDGLDVNGAIEMTGGTVIVNGPTEQNNAALDYDGGFTITGGTLVAAGSSGMAQAPGTSSGQNSVAIFFTSTLQAGALVNIRNAAGDDVLTFAPAKQYQSLVFSSPELVSGETYTIYVDGSASGEAVAGLYADGSYTPGSEYGSFTVSGVVTTVGTGGGFGGPRRRGP